MSKRSEPDIAIFYRNTAVGQMTAALLSHLCSEDVVIRALRDPQQFDPIAAKVLEEVHAEPRVTSPPGKLREAYREVIYITDEGAPRRRSAAFPRGAFRVWRLPTLDPGEPESDYVRLIRARIVRSMLLSKLQNWCATHCQQPIADACTPDREASAVPGAL